MRGDSDGKHRPQASVHAPNGSSTSQNGTTSNGVNGFSAQAAPDTGRQVRQVHEAHDTAPTFFGHDREEVARIMIQGLQDLGYHGAANALSQESGFELESPFASAFRLAILDGVWSEAESLLLDDTVLVTDRLRRASGRAEAREGPANGSSSSGQPESADIERDSSRTEMLFLIKQQKYLELLEKRDISAALIVLRQELNPLHQEQRQLHALSSLMMCQSAEDLRMQADWDGALGESRKLLLTRLSRELEYRVRTSWPKPLTPTGAISPSVMIPEHRLATLFDQHKASQVRDCVYHNSDVYPSLYTDHDCAREQIPTELHTELDQHLDQVWFCAFSNDGTRLATASKDHSIIIYDTTGFRPKYVLKEHREAVAYVAWSPDDSRLVSCSKDHEARLWDTTTGRCVRLLKYHQEPVTSAAWGPDGKTFVTASLDLQRSLCLWPADATSPHASPLHTFETGARVEGCAIGTLSPQLSDTKPNSEVATYTDRSSKDSSMVRMVAFCINNTIHVFDYLRREKLRHITLDHTPTCVSLSRSGQQMLINLNCGEIWTIGVEDGQVRQKFTGQQQGNFMIRSCFGGATEGFIVSGGEDGRVRLWHRHSGRMLEELDPPRLTGPPNSFEGDASINAVSWNKANPNMFASVSDDRKVQIQSWCTPHPTMSQAEVLERNRQSHNMFRSPDELMSKLPRWDQTASESLSSAFSPNSHR